MTDVVELFRPVYRAEPDGTLILDYNEWIGLLIPEHFATSRQAAVEILQRHAVESRGWPAYPGSAGVTGPYPYTWRGDALVRSVRWAAGDRDAGRYWRALLGSFMGDDEPGGPPVVFDLDDLDSPSL